MQGGLFLLCFCIFTIIVIGGPILNDQISFPVHPDTALGPDNLVDLSLSADEGQTFSQFNPAPSDANQEPLISQLDPIPSIVQNPSPSDPDVTPNDDIQSDTILIASKRPSVPSTYSLELTCNQKPGNKKPCVPQKAGTGPGPRVQGIILNAGAASIGYLIIQAALDDPPDLNEPRRGDTSPRAAALEEQRRRTEWIKQVEEGWEEYKESQRARQAEEGEEKGGSNEQQQQPQQEEPQLTPDQKQDVSAFSTFFKQLDQAWLLKTVQHILAYSLGVSLSGAALEAAASWVVYLLEYAPMVLIAI